MLKRVLIANRGEIAVRIQRACRELGVATVAVHSEPDATAPHVTGADAAVCLGPGPSVESYLRADKILEAAKATGADAIHPGYGFLAENADFARQVEDAGLVFIGPTPHAVEAMGDKVRSRHRVAAVGVPVTPACPEPPTDLAALTRAADDVGYPLLVKASAGGGGKGMRLVRHADELEQAFQAAGREAQAAFGDPRVFLERYVERPRHVEIQVFGDAHGNLIHLGERECSIQRRHQKIIEESPSPVVDPDLRRRMAEAALLAARSVDYRGAGTVEFLLDQDGSFYFLEMNTRLQVEHPITEWVTGVDLVQAQLRVAAGETLWLRQDDIDLRGHAIEARLCAEDPMQGFRPTPGLIVGLREPRGPGIRWDAGVCAGYEVTPLYDSLLAKLSVHAPTRAAACERMAVALSETAVLGCTTNLSFLKTIVEHPAFRAGATHTHFIDDHLANWPGASQHRLAAAIAAALAQPLGLGAKSAAAAGETTPSVWEGLGAWRLGGGGRA